MHRMLTSCSQRHLHTSYSPSCSRRTRGDLQVVLRPLEAKLAPHPSPMHSSCNITTDMCLHTFAISSACPRLCSIAVVSTWLSGSEVSMSGAFVCCFFSHEWPSDLQHAVSPHEKDNLFFKWTERWRREGEMGTSKGEVWWRTREMGEKWSSWHSRKMIVFSLCLLWPLSWEQLYSANNAQEKDIQSTVHNVFLFFWFQ